MRSLWIKIHLYIAAFFAPMLLLMAVSGGLYLIGEKGSTTLTPITLEVPTVIDAKSESLKSDVEKLLTSNGIEHEFEYVKVSGTTLYTRPTSRTHFEIKTGPSTPAVSRVDVSLQKAMIELHKGHGPLWFKDLQKVMAIGLLIVLLSGVWLGLSSPGLRLSTGLTTLGGLVVFVLVALVI